MRAAVKLQVTISKDRLVQLPADLPEGQAEIIVLYPEGTDRASRADAEQPRNAPIDYFARLTASQPHPLSAEAAQALDEANRGER